MKELSEDEIRIIGKPKHRLGFIKWIIVGVCIIFVILTTTIVGTIQCVPVSSNDTITFEEEAYKSITIKKSKPLGKLTDEICIEKIDTIVNNIPLFIFIPHNAQIKLQKGKPTKSDKSILMCAQAADIRADNKKIVGAFVIAGTPIAWGLSKQGFCAIIDNTITIGRAENTSLFEEATEKSGYFFRQYALVDSCKIVENNPQNKSLRKALCQRDGETFMVMSATPESMHDFSQALVDFDVENAISLVGSGYSMGWYLNNETKEYQDFNAYQKRTMYNTETYIVWTK